MASALQTEVSSDQNAPKPSNQILEPHDIGYHSEQLAQSSHMPQAGAVVPIGDDAHDEGLAASVAPSVNAEDEAVMLSRSEALKMEGNALYASEQHADAEAKYLAALDAAPPGAKQRAVYYANLAACNLKLAQQAAAVENCSLALQIDPVYIKALMRRSSAFEELEDLDHALADAQQVASLDSENAWAPKTIARIQPQVAAKQEAVKEEMLGKLKDLGNTILGKFGMSIDNFKAEKDPSTGSYSIKFER